MSLVLWHCRDARSFRVLWALEELDLSYELKILPFPPRALQKSFLGENVLGTVPLLVDGAARMTESCAIPHYLAMKYGEGRLTLAPDHPDYAAYLNWLFHGEATLTFPQTLVLRYARFEPEERRQPAVAQDYRRWFLARLRLLEATLGDGRAFLVGGAFSMADIAVAYAILLAHDIGLEAELPPFTIAWYRKLALRDGFRRAKAAQDA